MTEYKGTMEVQELREIIDFLFPNTPVKDLEELMSRGFSPPKHNPEVEATQFSGELFIIPQLQEPALLRKTREGKISGIALSLVRNSYSRKIIYEMYTIPEERARELYDSYISLKEVAA